ncbi:tRNA (guanosine(46)-N7)-methyltransferase TrmB [Paenibacillus aquistagni]|uniref:tRNA (guanosine(46)-N7)-methyltransferase TrmB n=1 Tax=Paenibacillus aquistagni TaxID=1852522 RepID=UPI00145C142B|nr:tRNA (guanosine(46)-N7)-methyltransferase TrmB [Paenibacillus aquistagni]NMM54857.1 tRNA (guanosine(46)-N7)-methyltransferase TrmB [Paenibacillus aquistagni]
MRLRGKKNAPELLANLPNLVITEPTAHKGKWSQVFGNDRPIYVELGMGKGQFVTEMSVKYPNINFIGIDMYDELIARASEKAMAVSERAGDAEQHPSNLRLMRANIEFMETFFEENELSRIYLNFSDPWPKKKHARRRLTHPRFLEKYALVMNEWGEIHQKTDSETLFEFSLNAYAHMEYLMKDISLNLHRDGIHEEHVMTEYEQKFFEKGMNIHRVEVLIGEAAVKQHREAKLKGMK